MLATLPERQQSLMRHLLRHRDGLSIDEMVDLIPVTRTAVRQHLHSLEKLGLVATGSLEASGGRPKRRYVLTSRGLDLFPKQYSWFSSLLLAALANTHGPDGLGKFLESLAGEVAAQLRPRLEGKSPAQMYAEVTAILNELSFDARLAKEKGSQEPVLEASNCVYHHLAIKYPEVCSFDRALLSNLTGRDVEQRECIVRGGNVCRFTFSKGKHHG